jgi:hypothetical protein
MANDNAQIFIDQKFGYAVRVLKNSIGDATVHTIILTQRKNGVPALIESTVMLDVTDAKAIRAAIDVIDAQEWRAKHELHINVTQIAGKGVQS